MSRGKPETVQLHQRGAFTWNEWTNTLGVEIARAKKCGDPDPGNMYFVHWARALEKIVIKKGFQSAKKIDARVESWRSAYLKTPHGNPVELILD